MTAAAPETPATSGQAAYELWAEVISTNGGRPVPFDALGNVEQMAWREVEAARQPQPAPGDALRKALVDLVNFWAVGGNGINAESEDLISACSAELLRVLDEHPEQPAPELAAAKAALARVLGWFGDNTSGRYARVSGTVLARAYRDGGLTVPEELRRFL